MLRFHPFHLPVYFWRRLCFYCLEIGHVSITESVSQHEMPEPMAVAVVSPPCPPRFMLNAINSPGMLLSQWYAPTNPNHNPNNANQQ